MGQTDDRVEWAADFVAHVGQEFPLDVVGGLTHLALKTGLSPQQLDYLSNIRISSQNLLNIVTDLLDFSKIEAGQMTLERVPFRLDQALERVMAMQMGGAEAKGLRLSHTLAPGIPCGLKGDPLRLEQVLLNLVGNAVKFTRSGEVELSVRILKVDETEACLELMVRDTGIGLTPEQLAVIFEPFTQADGSITRRFGGTGLGLSICRHLVGLMGGELSATSVPGQGSSFVVTVTFPVAELPAECYTEEGPVALLLGKRFLVADDLPVNRQVILEVLELLGAEVTAVGTGLEAVAAVEADPHGFDLIFMDLQMPEMDGYEATRLIREQWSPDLLPIIAITAHADPAERERCLAAGMNDHWAKPLTTVRLTAGLVRHLRLPVTAAPWPETGLVHEWELPADLPGLDVAQGLAQLGGYTPLYRKMAVRVSREQVLRNETIREALAGGDREAARKRAHALKGVAGMLAAPRLLELTTALDAALVEGATDLEPLLAELETAMAEVRYSVDRLTEGSDVV